MQVKDIMTPNPACCTPDAGLREVAQMMVDYDCGAVPVVEGQNSMKLVGVITDRDIVCRVVALGMNPQDATVRDAMSRNVVTATPETSVEDCLQLMEENQVRRIPVVDNRGNCCGIVAQADVALNASRQATAEVVQEISEPAR
jgi:CBS domain-containing protein